MSLEFKWAPYNPHRRRVFEPVEIGDDFQVVFQDKPGRRKLVSNGTVAFEIISRGKLYDQLLLAYEFEQRRRQQPPKSTVQKAEEKPAPPVVETVVQIEEVVASTVQFDEQAETQDADYKLSASDWFECVIQRVSNNGRTLILELTNATATCVPMKVTQSPGDHKCTYLVGLTGAVRLELVGDVYRALELQVLGEPTTLRETAKIIWWDPIRNLGKAVRECGCRIFIGSFDNVYGPIDVGDWVVFDLERSRSKGNWIGLRARKFDAPQMAQEIKENGI